MLQVVKVLLHNGGQSMEAHAVLDDGYDRTMVLPPVIQQLKLNGAPSHTELEGSTVTLAVSPITKPTKRYVVNRNAFTASGLYLAEQNYPVAALQKAYRHMKGLPLLHVDRVKPLLLIGSHMPHLLTPTSLYAREQAWLDTTRPNVSDSAP